MQQSVSLYLILYKQHTLFVSVLVWGTPVPSYPLPQTHTHTELISLNLHIGCRCAPRALLVLSSGLKEQPVSGMYSSPGTGKREHLANHRGHFQLLLGASLMSLLLTVLWPKEVTWPNVMSVGLGSRPLPQKGASGPIATSSDI